MNNRRVSLKGLIFVLLMLVLGTSGVVGTTFAKFATGKNAQGQARVAAFGVTIENANGEMFLDQYSNDDKVVVAAQASEKVVAPGTKGTVPTLTINGTTEVAVKVEYELTLQLTNWTVDADEFYCPLTFTINGQTIKGTTYQEASTLIEALKAELQKATKEYAPNTELTNNLTFEWEWTFEGNNDAKDTKLGTKADKPTIDLTIRTVVTQINTLK